MANAAGWSFHNPTRVHFGPGVRKAVLDIVKSEPVLVVTTPRGRRQFETDAILGRLARNSPILWAADVQSNPDLGDFDYLEKLPRIADVATIIAFGGGSAMDSAKAISALLACRSLGVGLRQIIESPAVLEQASCPAVHALPTTAGTGSEVTPFATVWDHASRRKLSLNHPSLFPATAIVDPELTRGVPADVTMATALDALNQAFESIWNRNASPYTLRLAGLAIERAFYAIPRLAVDLESLDARTAMAEASLMAGLCISQTRTAICHSISYPLTAHFGLPHGVACAFTMRAVAEAVLAECGEALEHIAPLAGAASAAALVSKLGEVLDVSGIQKQWEGRLPSRAALEALTEEMVTPGRSDNFILPVDRQHLTQIIGASLDD